MCFGRKVRSRCSPIGTVLAGQNKTMSVIFKYQYTLTVNPYITHRSWSNNISTSFSVASGSESEKMRSETDLTSAGGADLLAKLASVFDASYVVFENGLFLVCQAVCSVKGRHVDCSKAVGPEMP